MSQGIVESVLGRLIADDAFRRRFLRRPEHTLAACGARLTAVEIAGLRRIDTDVLEQAAESLDDRIRRADLDLGQTDPFGAR